jgi:hypothetical protein
MWRVLMIGVRLTIVLCGIEGMVLAGSAAYHDPFASYTTMMPGQPSTNLEIYPCNIYRDGALTEYCTFELKEGSFDSVAVEYDHVIKRIGFTVRPDRLHLSDLIVCWGAPTSVEPNYRLNEIGRTDVHWSRQIFANLLADQKDTHLSYLLPIYYVSIAGEWRPCG